MIILLSDAFRVTIALFLILLLFAVLHIKYNVKDEITIIERLGKFKKMVDTPGFFFIMPFIDRVLERTSTGEIVDARRFSYKDGASEIKVNATMRYIIFDPKLFAYAAIDPIGSIVDLIKTAKENDISDEDLDLQVRAYGRDLGITIINYYFD